MRRPLLSLVVCLFATASLLHAASDSRLAQILTPEEYARAGLAKLSPEELAALETALVTHRQLAPLAPPTPLSPLSPSAQPTAPSSGSTAKASASGTTSAAAGFGSEQIARPVPADSPGELRSRIEGTVREFSGRAVFVLENGQIWQQRVAESVVLSKKLENPEVVITRSLGGYKMLIVAADRVVFVKRVQ